MIRHKKLISYQDYEKYIDGDTIKRIERKAKPLKDMHVVHINSTYYGGGISELLQSLSLLMNSVGIKTGWRIIQGTPDFFSVTKKMHNALQSGDINLTDRKKQIYEDIVRENAVR
ncbi:MAG: glycosyl transferase family 1, partial [Candidatus Kapaibacterium sp.]